MNTDQLVASVRADGDAHVCLAFFACFWIFVVVKGLHALCCCSIIQKQLLIQEQATQLIMLKPGNSMDTCQALQLIVAGKEVCSYAMNVG